MGIVILFVMIRLSIHFKIQQTLYKSVNIKKKHLSTQVLGQMMSAIFIFGTYICMVQLETLNGYYYLNDL